jgi:hypothetical protein
MNAMSCRSAKSRPCVVWRRVDGSSSTVAASLHRGIESPCAVAYPLRVTSRSVPYCCCPAVSMSCTYLMLNIRRVWLVLYVFNALPTLHACEAMMILMLGALGMHGHTSEAEGHGARSDVRALPHQETGLGLQDTW